jgi:hypothetical protein
MVAVGVVLVLIGLLVIGLCVWLGDGRAKGVAVLGFIAGIFVSTTGLATGFRNFIISLLT